MNVTSKMYLNECVKGFTNEGPTRFPFFLWFHAFNLQKGKGPFSRDARFPFPRWTHKIQCVTHEPY